MIRLALLFLLMCENVNAAPQGGTSQNPEEAKLSAGTTPGGSMTDGRQLATDSRLVGAAPFTLVHPLCPTGFMLSQRIDTRDRFGIIVKRQWVPGCARAPKPTWRYK